ncbi:hypothetical protein T439DRAFT_105359 [Meredithblackwellia eburnea MCA 4105]
MATTTSANQSISSKESKSANIPTLPLPRELQSLLAKHSSLLTLRAQLVDLSERTETLLQARRTGNGTMTVPVDLGLGYCLDGVVRETDKMFVRDVQLDLGKVSSEKEEKWLEMEVEKVPLFVKGRLQEVDQRTEALKDPIEKLKKDYALVTKTIRSALDLPEESESGTKNA